MSLLQFHHWVRDHSGQGPANERQQHIATWSFIGRAHAQNDPWSKLSLLDMNHILVILPKISNVPVLQHNYRGIARPCFDSSPLEKMAAILADDNFKYIFLNENDRIPIRISLKFVPRSPVDKISQHWFGNSLSQNRRQAIAWTNSWPSSMTHRCGTRGRWVNCILVIYLVWFWQPSQTHTITTVVKFRWISWNTHFQRTSLLTIGIAHWRKIMFYIKLFGQFNADQLKLCTNF